MVCGVSEGDDWVQVLWKHAGRQANLDCDSDGKASLLRKGRDPRVVVVGVTRDIKRVYTARTLQNLVQADLDARDPIGIDKEADVLAGCSFWLRYNNRSELMLACVVATTKSKPYFSLERCDEFALSAMAGHVSVFPTSLNGLKARYELNDSKTVIFELSR